ncbi:MAG: carbohydrate ABC transporter permease [Anaerolineae bacterium]
MGWSIYRLRKRAANLLTYLLAVVIGLVMAFPLLTLVRVSFFTRLELYAKPMLWLPKTVKWQNYVDVLAPDHIVPIKPAITNSLIVACSAATLTVVLASLAAYAFARFRFPGRNVLQSLLLSVYLLPAILFLIPIFMMWRPLKLLDTHISLIVPYTVWMTPFVILILRDFFQSVPEEIEDAALVDGCTQLSVIWHIILPLAGPGLVAAWVSAFIMSWNEFLTPLILTSKLKVITVALGQYTSTYDIQLGHMAAAGVYAILPVLILTLIFQRRIEQGITAGSLKG